MRDKCSSALNKITTWAELEVYKQLALYSAVDSASFDVVQLAYALVIYVEGYRRVDKKVNEKIVSRAIEVIFSSQLPDGLWPKCHPIFHYETRGNVYTFSFEMLDVLLSLVDLSPDYFSVFRPYLDKLEVSLRWAEQNRLERKRDGYTLKGWRSNHLVIQDGPEAWSTAAVFNALRRIELLVRFCLNDDILTEFHATRIAAADWSRFDKLYDCDVKLPHGVTSLKETIRKHLIDPHLSSADARNRKYSAIFFGPPATAKTSLAEAIAYALGWPFIHLQTSDFLKDGFDRVTGRARYIFERLNLLEKAVILIDEVEEFVRNREEKNLPPQSRMITTSMLTLIQDLRRQQKVIFIVATNRLETFDEAVISNPGRFDLVLLISPPSLSEKKRMFRDRVAEIPSLKDNTEVLTLFDRFTDEHKDCIQFFSHREWDRLIDDVIAEFQSKPNLSQEDLTRVLERYKDAIAIQGGLRKAYLKSQTMSRIF